MRVTLEIRKLYVKAEDKKILNGVSLACQAPEIHAIMGPNGSGKSTLAKVIMGHPGYTVTSGQVLCNSVNILKQEPNVRAKRGVFLAFQYPIEVPGVNMFSYLRAIYGHRHGLPKKPARYKHAGGAKHRSEAHESSVSVEEFQAVLQPILKELHIKEDFIERSVNEGFSGGEKKKAEILQLAVLNPKVIILDETDSGLDIDALKVVAEGVKKFRPKDSIVLIITHYQRILRYIKPDFVHVMMEGKIVASGDYTLAQKIERGGYKTIKS